MSIIDALLLTNQTHITSWTWLNSTYLAFMVKLLHQIHLKTPSQKRSYNINHWCMTTLYPQDLLPLLAETHISTFPLCLLYTSDAADERSSVDLGGRRIIKK